MSDKFANMKVLWNMNNHIQDLVSAKRWDFDFDGSAFLGSDDTQKFIDSPTFNPYRFEAKQYFRLDPVDIAEAVVQEVLKEKPGTDSVVLNADVKNDSRGGEVIFSKHGYSHIIRMPVALQACILRGNAYIGLSPAQSA